MRSATSSRQGAAMICTPIGSGCSGTGTATTGRPMKEIGCVKMPMLGRSGTSCAVEHHGLLADARGGERRGRRQDGVDALEQLQHLLAIPAAELLRLDHQRGRHHGAGDQAVAHGGVEIGRPRAQAVEVQRAALGRR